MATKQELRNEAKELAEAVEVLVDAHENLTQERADAALDTIRAARHAVSRVSPAVVPEETAPEATPEAPSAPKAEKPKRAPRARKGAITSANSGA